MQTSHRKIPRRPTGDWNPGPSCCEDTSEHLCHPGGNLSNPTRLNRKNVEAESASDNVYYTTHSVEQLTALTEQADDAHAPLIFSVICFCVHFSFSFLFPIRTQCSSVQIESVTTHTHTQTRSCRLIPLSSEPPQQHRCRYDQPAWSSRPNSAPRKPAQS